MLRFLISLMIAVTFTCGPAGAGATYDMLFRSGTLSGNVALDYRQEVRNAATDESARVTLRSDADDIVELRLHVGAKTRGLGRFPAPPGNPMIMYFLESVLRDMAEQTSGSPFYLRNRLKEALLRDNDIVPIDVVFDGRQIAARRITMHPFEHDTARDRMGAFADLTLVFTVSEDIPGRYLSLVAKTAEQKTAAYSYALTQIPVTKENQ